MREEGETKGTDVEGLGAFRYPTPGVSVDEVVDMVTVSDVALSPDGATVAYTLGRASKADEHPVGHIYLTSVGGGQIDMADGALRPFTGGVGLDATPRWSPDSARLAFVSDRERRGAPHLYVVDTHGGEARRLSDTPGAVAEPAWSPDGARLAYLVVDADDDEAQRRTRERDDPYVASEAWKRRRLWARDAADDAEVDPVAITPADRHVWAYAWAPDGRSVVAMVSPTPEWNETFDGVRLVIYPVASEAGSPHDLGPAPYSAFGLGLVWSRDGSRIYALGSAAREFPETYLRVWRTDEDADEGPVALLRDLPATPLQVTRARDADALLLLAWEGTHTPLYRVSPDGALVDRLPLPVASEGEASAISVSADGARVALICGDALDPGNVWVWDAAAGMRRVTNLNPWLRERCLGRQRDFWWTGADGETIEGLLITPPGYSAGQRYPLVVVVHGGPTWLWTDHCHLNWHDWGHWLALHGMVTLLPNPRGSAGRGNRFARANVGDIGGGDYEDVMAGVDDLIARGIADEERLGIGGWSYGGTLTPWTLTKTNRFQCAVMGAGICNWVSFTGTSDIRLFGDLLHEAELNRDAALLWARSALSRVSHVQTPTLIVHGEQDVRVPVSQAREFYTALRARGIPTELVTYPREGHQVGERLHQRDLLVRLRDWFVSYLRPDAPADAER